MRGTVALLLLAALSLPALPGPDEAKEKQEKVLNDTADKIGKDTGVKKDMLMKDKDAILLSLPELTKEHKKNDISEDQTLTGAVKVWQQTRGVKGLPQSKLVLAKDESLSADQFLGIFSGYGHLTVESDPDKAQVTIRKVAWGETKCDNWEEAGTWPITVKKAGYETLEDTVRFDKGKDRKFKAVLKKSGG
jgi:hypothetical protein